MSFPLFRYWFGSLDGGVARSGPNARAAIERLENRVVLSASVTSFHAPLAAANHPVDIHDLATAADLPPSTTIISASSSNSTSGQSVVLTARVTTDIGTAIGTVTFQDGSNTLGTANLVSGSATLTTSSLAIGPHSISAVYGGSSTAAGSTSAVLPLTVAAQTTVTLSAAPTASTYGQIVSFTAAVNSTAGTPTGTVEFMERARISPARISGPVSESDLVFDRTIGSATLVNGVATFSTSGLAPGVQTIIAVYGGDADFTGSSSPPLAFTVAQVPAAIAFSLPPTVGTPGQALSPIIVDVTDALGNIVTTYESPVTLSINSGPAGGSLGGTVTVNAVNGVATFDNVRLSTFGNYSLTAVSTTLPMATSPSIAVLPSTTVPVLTATAGARIATIQATVPATAKRMKFTIAIAGRSGVKLHGPKSIRAKKGHLAFHDLHIATAGTYVLTISEAGVGPVVESTIVIQQKS